MGRNLVLIGYRGAGKSTLARKLKKILKMPLVSTDEELVARFGMPIADWVAAQGWDEFRRIEAEVVRDAAAPGDHIVDCGGGVVERPENIECLRRSGVVFYLTGSVRTLTRRIHPKGGRPSLTGKDPRAEVAEVLARRDPLYRGAAHFIIDVNGGMFFTAAARIAKIWRREHGR